MSNPRRKVPAFGIATATSEKTDKRRWDKTFRRISNTLIFKQKELPFKLSAVTNASDRSKDGKRYAKDYSSKVMRK